MNPPLFQRLGLKARITLLTLAVFLIGMWGLSAYFYQTLRDDLQTLLGQQVGDPGAHRLDDDLRAEGFVRELTNRVQTVRKDEDLGYTERIALRLVTDAASAAGSEWSTPPQHTTAAPSVTPHVWCAAALIWTKMPCGGSGDGCAVCGVCPGG